MTESSPIFARDIYELDDFDSVLNDAERIQSISDQIRDGDVYVLKSLFSKELVSRLKSYLKSVGSGSLPNYHPIEEGCPNFHRINQWDERAYVKGCFHQFVFFPWNQDLFELFRLAQPGFMLKNLINGIPADKFYGREPEDGCTARIAFQFYPSGMGALNRHIDPVDHHQMTVPIMIMSKRGKDFQTGGNFVERESGERIYLDEVCDEGDVVYFNAHMPHGVELIDEGSKVPWIDFCGRWMMLFATNKLADNKSVADALEV